MQTEIDSGVTIRTTDDFFCPPANVLNAALAAEPDEVVVIHRKGDRVEVAGSHSGVMVEALIRDGLARIGELTWADDA